MITGAKKINDLPVTTADEGQGESPRPVTPTPTETIYMQIVDFLLEVKAMSVSASVLKAKSRLCQRVQVY